MAAGESSSLDVTVDGSLPSPPSAPQLSTRHLRTEPIWLPAGMLAVLLMLTMAITASGAETATVPSGWASSGWASTVTTPTKATANTAIKSRPARAWRSASRAKSATRVASRPAATIKRVAFDEDLYGASRGKARMQSIVVQEETYSGPDYQIAQADEPDFGSELEQALSEPFGPEELPEDDDNMFEPGDDLDDQPFGDMDDLGDDSTLPEIDDPMPEVDNSFGDFNDAGMDEANDTDATEGATQMLPPIDSPSNDEPMKDPFDEQLPPPDQFDNFDSPEMEDDDSWETKRSESSKNCAEELAELKAHTLSMIDITIGPKGQEGKDYPFICSIDDGTPFAGRAWPEVTYMWKASALCHKPLYFEDVHLERYGHSWGPYLDPLVSGAHFFTRLPALPYCMGLKTPNECVYSLGYYRPGNCAPYLIEQPGFTCRAAGFAIGAWTTGAFVIP